MGRRITLLEFMKTRPVHSLFIERALKTYEDVTTARRNFEFCFQRSNVTREKKTLFDKTIAQTRSILDIEGMGAFFRANFMKKRHFVCLQPLNKCHFYPFLMKIFFSKLRALDWVR